MEEPLKVSLNKLKSIQLELNEVLLERETPIRLSILALIAEENLILFGPPGTGKSYLAMEICKRIQGGAYFQRLLTKSTREEELFVSGLQIEEELDKKTKSKCIRMKDSHENMLPLANIAFLDEVFKSNSAILNSLLTLMNEKIFYVEGGRFLESKLISVFGASNERPSAEDGLDPFFDRFLLRIYVDKLTEDNFVKLLKQSATPSPKHFISIEELKSLKASLSDIRVPEIIYRTISDFRSSLELKPKLSTLHPSDRRLKKAIDVLKASALIEGREEVDKDDLINVLPFVLWETSSSTNRKVNFDILKELEAELSKGNADLQMAQQFKTKAIEIEKQMNELYSKINSNSTMVDLKKLADNYLALFLM